MTNGRSGSLVGAIIPLAFLGISLGILGGIVRTTERAFGGRRQLSRPRRMPPRRVRMRRTGII